MALLYIDKASLALLDKLCKDQRIPINLLARGDAPDKCAVLSEGFYHGLGLTHTTPSTRIDDTPSQPDQLNLVIPHLPYLFPAGPAAPTPPSTNDTDRSTPLIAFQPDTITELLEQYQPPQLHSRLTETGPRRSDELQKAKSRKSRSAKTSKNAKRSFSEEGTNKAQHEKKRQKSNEGRDQHSSGSGPSSSTLPLIPDESPDVAQSQTPLPSSSGLADVTTLFDPNTDTVDHFTRTGAPRAPATLPAAVAACKATLPAAVAACKATLPAAVAACNTHRYQPQLRVGTSVT